MSTKEEREAQIRENRIKLVKKWLGEGYSYAEIAEKLEIEVNDVRLLMEDEINWGYNCLTQGVHHGRPEALWRISLLQAISIFSKDELKSLVVARIHTDALIYVHRGENPPTKEWAEKTKQYAEEHYDRTLQHKVGEISNYYRSPGFHTDMEGVIDRVKDNRLNPNYEPLHPHDSINMLCRILGVPASIAGAKEE